MFESLIVEQLDPRDETDQVTPIEDLVPVALNDDLPDRVVNIGSFFNVGPCEELIQFFTKNQDLFAWCHDAMPGIDLRITSYRLNVNPNLRPVKQNRRAMALE